jgi:hypothetical protein
MFTARFLVRSGVVAMLSAAVMFATACGGGSDDTSNGAPTTGAPATPTATAEEAAGDPVGLIALGHSGMNAQNSNPEMPGWGAPQNSWATGTSSEFESVYERLVALNPERLGHVFNAAEGGSTSDALVDQAKFALRAVPAPELVLIMMIGNDIRCDGTDDTTRVRAFGENVAETLQVIIDQSPRSRILLVSDYGRPARFAEAGAADPVLFGEMSGTGMCDFYTHEGELSEERIAYVTGIIEDYEAEQARVCERVPQCSTDGGALTTYQDDLSRVIRGDGHLNIAGQAAIAELIWPTIQSVLEAPEASR